MLILAGLLLAAIAAVLVARQTLDRLARRHRWRVGRWSDVLPGWHYPRCLRCKTSFRYVPAHELAYESAIRPGVTGRVSLRALCDPCHLELATPGGRIAFYEDAWRLLEAQDAAAGVQSDVADLISIRAAVEIGA